MLFQTKTALCQQAPANKDRSMLSANTKEKTARKRTKGRRMLTNNNNNRRRRQRKKKEVKREMEIKDARSVQKITKFINALNWKSVDWLHKP